MVIGVPRELQPGEHRAAMIPANIQKLVRAGAEVLIESGLGLGAGHTDEDYAKAGAHVTHDRAALLARADMVLRLHKPPRDASRPSAMPASAALSPAGLRAPRASRGWTTARSLSRKPAPGACC